MNTEWHNKKEADVNYFTFMLEKLTQEINIINSAIQNADRIAQETKNWAVVVWTGAIFLSLSIPILNKFVWLTAVPPLIFGFVDAWWRHLQKRSIERLRRLSDYLNSKEFKETFSTYDFTGFKVIDPVGKQYWHEKEFKKATSVFRTIRYPEIYIFYIGMIIISLILSFILVCK